MMPIIAIFVGYLDPGSGSYLFQLLIAGITGAIFFLHHVKNKIRSFFAGSKRHTPKDSVDEQSNSLQKATVVQSKKDPDQSS